MNIDFSSIITASIISIITGGIGFAYWKLQVKSSPNVANTDNCQPEVNSENVNVQVNKTETVMKHKNKSVTYSIYGNSNTIKIGFTTRKIILNDEIHRGNNSTISIWGTGSQQIVIKLFGNNNKVNAVNNLIGIVTMQSVGNSNELTFMKGKLNE